jgi:hypothetical protein
MKACFLGLLLAWGPVMAGTVAGPTATLLSRLPEAPIVKAADIQPKHEPPPARPPVPALPRPAEPEQLVVITPDPDGVLDESALPVLEEPDAIPNPFRVRYHPPLPMRDVRVGIDSILIGAGSGQDCAVINGKLYSAGDVLCGLRISSISDEAVDLRHGELLLRLPVQDKPVTLRLPKTSDGAGDF